MFIMVMSEVFQLLMENSATHKIILIMVIKFYSEVADFIETWLVVELPSLCSVMADNIDIHMVMPETLVEWLQ